jgi:hypothetical protein
VGISGGGYITGSISTYCGGTTFGSTFASVGSGVIVAGTTFGSTFAGTGGGVIVAGIGLAWPTNAITDVNIGPTLFPFWPLEGCFQPARTYSYRVPTTTWLEELKTAKYSIDELALLQENWDGYGASAISRQACEHARYFLNEIEASPFEVPIPDISPKPTGTISFEWEAPHAEAYIEVGNTRYSGFIRVYGQKQPVLLQGDASSIDQNIVALIHNAMAVPPPAASAPTIVEIRAQPQWSDERLAA